MPSREIFACMTESQSPSISPLMNKNTAQIDTTARMIRLSTGCWRLNTRPTLAVGQRYRRPVAAAAARADTTSTTSTATAAISAG